MYSYDNYKMLDNACETEYNVRECLLHFLQKWYVQVYCKNSFMRRGGFGLAVAVSLLPRLQGEACSITGGAVFFLIRVVTYFTMCCCGVQIGLVWKCLAGS